MSDRKLENYVLWALSAVLILSLLALIGSMLSSGKDFHILAKLVDPIAILIGALIGALITGKIANDIHRKEFQRQEVAEQKASFVVRKVMFYYTDNIARALEEARSDAGNVEIYNVYLESKNLSVDEKEEIKKLISETIDNMVKNMRNVIKEYQELCEVSVEKLELEILLEYLKYRSRMRNEIMSNIEKAIKNESFTLIDYDRVREINSEFLRVNNI